jgi:hypothetical protein
MPRKLLVLPIAILSFAVSGCAGLEDWHYRGVNRYRAYSAWSNAKSTIPSGRVDRDFARGWKDGYFDVSTGASETQPAVPPAQYWGTKFQSQEGRCRIENYYAGWQCGANAAISSCRPYLNAVPAKVAAPPMASMVNSYMHCEPPIVAEHVIEQASQPVQPMPPETTPPMPQ